MQAIVVDPQAPQRIGFQTVDLPTPQDNEALIRVQSISLNRGEVAYLAYQAAGTRIGWDLAGVVERAAADRSGPAQGTRVVGAPPTGSWAELVAVPTDALVELPPSVSFAQAATLPCAGLTALYALDHGGNLVARPVLITGASGGVGLFACQLASLAGAQVVAQVRHAEAAALVQDSGADHVLVDENIAAAAEFGRYHLIFEQLGSQTLAEAMTQLTIGGLCVSVGGTVSQQVSLDRLRIRQSPGANLHFFSLAFEFKREVASVGLRRLVSLVSTGKLIPHIAIEADWHEVGRVAQALLDRQFLGKAVCICRSKFAHEKSGL